MRPQCTAPPDPRDLRDPDRLRREYEKYMVEHVLAPLGVTPPGDIYLTAEDMARFLAMHLNGGMFRGKRILTEASVNAMHEPQFGGTYAFGFSVRKDPNGHTIISHSGGIPGQSSYMVGDLDAKVGVYFMSNSGAPTGRRKQAGCGHQACTGHGERQARSVEAEVGLRSFW